jgi:hypothetical protein
MEPAGHRTVRTVLRASVLTFLGLYLLTASVALATSGVPFGGGAIAWYAAAMPVFYGMSCAFWAFGRLDGRLSRPALWALHLLTAPSLVYSFLGLGLLLPAIAARWWVAAGKPPLIG